MRSNTARAAAGAVVVVLAVVLFVAFQSGDDDNGGTPADQTTGQQSGADNATTGNGGTPPPAPPVPTIRIQGGALAGDIEQIDVSTGEMVRFRVVADQAWDLHVHGYEVEDQVQPGQPLEVSFSAEIEGTFEAEVHGDAGEFPIAEINVSPS